MTVEQLKAFLQTVPDNGIISDEYDNDLEDMVVKNGEDKFTFKQYKIDLSRKSNKIIALSEEFSEYELDEVYELNPDIFVYWYETGSYDGSGTAMWRNKNGTYGRCSLSHCSCYGPTECLESQEFTWEDLLKVIEKDYDYEKHDYEKMLELIKK